MAAPPQTCPAQWCRWSARASDLVGGCLISTLCLVATYIPADIDQVIHESMQNTRQKHKQRQRAKWHRGDKDGCREQSGSKVNTTPANAALRSRLRLLPLSANSLGALSFGRTTPAVHCLRWAHSLSTTLDAMNLALLAGRSHSHLTASASVNKLAKHPRLHVPQLISDLCMCCISLHLLHDAFNCSA